ncbi:MAG: radical SAM protein [Desulfuromonadaceae bacterium]|nr:radical SAM protein [Desulfuromonadaceae bacterium]
MIHSGPLRHAVLEITNRCNLRCAHCASNSGKARDDELSLAQWRKVLEEIRALGGEEITLLGGEPLLHPDWAEIAAWVGELGMRLVLLSNGLLMNTEEVLPQLKRLRPHLIGISLDGACAASYQQMRGVDGFGAVMQLLQQLVADGHPNVNAVTTFTRTNLGDFDRFVDLLEGSEITWQIQLAHGGGVRFQSEEFVTRDDFRRLVAKVRETLLHRPGVKLRTMDDFGYFPLDPALRFLHQTWSGCIAGSSLIGVRSNGDVLGCLSLGDSFVEANLLRTPLREIWTKGSCFRRFREKLQTLRGICAVCAFATECRAGCPGIAVSATGHLGDNPYCIRALETEAILDSITGGK